MLDLLDLVQLQNLGDPPLAIHQAPFGTDLQYLFAQRLQVDRNIVCTGEDICK
jgi:hypothetical protein